MTESIHHPYYPLDLQFDNYVENDLPLTGVFAYLNGGVAIVWIITFALRSLLRPNLKTSDTAILLWFTTCGALHLLFEGYYLLYYKDIVARNSVAAQLWKEYAKSDSKYVSGDLQLLSMEILTVALLSPLCFMTAAAILRDHPSRHILQFSVAFGHFYSCSLYFVSATVEGFPYTIPTPYYFWIYLVAFNLPWVIIPVLLMWQSGKTLSNAISQIQNLTNFKSQIQKKQE